MSLINFWDRIEPVSLDQKLIWMCLIPGLVHRLRAHHLRHVLAQRWVGDSSRARRHPTVHQTSGIVQPEIRKTGTFERSSAFLWEQFSADTDEAEHSQAAERVPAELCSLARFNSHDADLALLVGRRHHVCERSRLLLDPRQQRASDERRLQGAVCGASLAAHPRKPVPAVRSEVHPSERRLRRRRRRRQKVDQSRRFCLSKGFVLCHSQEGRAGPWVGQRLDLFL